VLLSLMVAAIAIGSLTYVLLSQNEENDFKNHFSFVSEELAHNSIRKLNSIMVTIATLSSLYPAVSHETGELINTIEDFEAFALGTRSIGGFESIVYTPILHTLFEVQAWNAYSANNTGWIPHGREFDALEAGEDHEEHHHRLLQQHEEEHQDDHEEEHHDDLEDVHITEYVWAYDDEGQEEKLAGITELPYAPVWQTSPVPADTHSINFNLASSPAFADLLAHVIETSEPILSDPGNIEAVLGPLSPNEHHAESPHSVLIQPVVDRFFHEGEPIVVGSLVTVFEWEHFFKDVSLALVYFLLTVSQRVLLT